jgi:hypothetical protein
MPDIHRTRTAITTALSALLGVALSGAASAGQAGAPPSPGIHTAGGRPHLQSGQMYTINDVGTPPATLTGSTPVAFNNSGQILGSAYQTKKKTDDCVLYTGSGTFADVSTPATDLECSPNGLSSADSNGVLRFVGYLNTPYEQSSIAFSGTYTVSTATATFTPYTANVPSLLSGVNVSGEAVGDAYYSPFSGFSTSEPLFVLLPAAKTLTLAQPQCTTSKTGCSSGAAGNACPFGGCAINDGGTTLSRDLATGKPLTYIYGQSGSGKDLSIKPSNTPQINNAGQVVYDVYNSLSGLYTTYIYATATSVTTTIPKIPGYPCSYMPLSMSNNGQVLGTTSCGIYWTYDPVNGTQNLNTEIPTNSYQDVYPLGINDNGQILVALYTATGATHWGTLNPPAAAAHPLHRAAHLSSRP